MNDKDIGYLAGVLDGEGCIHASRPWKKSKDRPNGRHHFDIRVIFTNNSQLLLEKVGRILRDLRIIYKYRPCSKPGQYEITVYTKEEIRKLLPVLVNDLAAKKRSAEETIKFLSENDDMRNGCKAPEEYTRNYIRLYNILKKQKGKSPLSVETTRQTSRVDEDIVRYSK